MALLQKILINKSGSTLRILGRSVANDGHLTVSSLYFLKLADESSCNAIDSSGNAYKVHDLITSSDIVVNNGMADLSASDGLEYVKTLAPDKSEDISFEQEGWSAENAKEAIIESVTKASYTLMGGIFNTSFVENGSAQNKWLDNNCQNVNLNETLYVVPFNCVITALTFSNKNYGTDFDI